MASTEYRKAREMRETCAIRHTKTGCGHESAQRERSRPSVAQPGLFLLSFFFLSTLPVLRLVLFSSRTDSTRRARLAEQSLEARMPEFQATSVGPPTERDGASTRVRSGFALLCQSHDGPSFPRAQLRQALLLEGGAERSRRMSLGSQIEFVHEIGWCKHSSVISRRRRLFLQESDYTHR